MKYVVATMLTVVAFAVNSFAQVYEKQGVVLNNAWARATTPSQQAGAIYMDITNNSDKKVILTGASSTAARMTEIHQTSMDADGSMNMDHMMAIELEPHQTVQFKPGGLHVMLMGLNQQLMMDTDIQLQLEFSNAPTQTYRVEVKPLTYQPEGHY